MTTRPLVDVATLMAFGLPGFDSQDSKELDRLIVAATEIINGDLEPRLIVADTGDYSEFYDGDLCVGRYHDELWLKNHPVISITSIKENGVTLTHATGYQSTTPDVLVTESTGLLRRMPGPAVVAAQYGAAYALGGQGWSGGRGNIEVTYRGGWEPSDVPADIIQWCVELVLAMKKEAIDPDTISVSRGGTALSRGKGLSEWSKRTRDRYMKTGRPRCWA